MDIVQAIRILGEIMGTTNPGGIMAIVCIVIGLAFIALGVQGIRQW